MKLNTSDFELDLGGKTFTEDILIQGPVRNITIKNGTITGEIRCRPDKAEGNTEKGYTERVRAVAPSRIRIERVIFDTTADTHQLYLGPGTTNCRVIDCVFTGSSKGPSIYLSPEGGEHRITGNTFRADIKNRREVLAVDGSEHNVIGGNTFKLCHWGGIYVYRNSGENGTVRHQKPQHNLIVNNDFNLRGMRFLRIGWGYSVIEVPHGIILGSRQGGSVYSHLDDEHDVGSGKSNLDFARNNTLAGNTFRGDWLRRHILDNDKNNTIKE
jgi:parallel beta-helix repeat protein